MSGDAIANNDKAFPVFAKMLVSDDPSVYSSFSQKLSVWLSSDRAYYPSAKPKILLLLETAQSTLQRQMGDNIQPFHISRCPPHLSQWSGAYEKLVQTVISHSRHFKDSILQDRVQRLALSISLVQQESPTSVSIEMGIPSGQNNRITSLDRPPQHSSLERVSVSGSLAIPSSVHPSTSPTAPQMEGSLSASQHKKPSLEAPSSVVTSAGQLSSQSLPPQTNPGQITSSSSVILPISPGVRPTSISVPQRASSLGTSGAVTPQLIARSDSIQDTLSPSAVTATSDTKSSAKPKAKKKRKSSANYADFLAADLEWYKERDKDKSHTGTADFSSSSMLPAPAPNPGGEKQLFDVHSSPTLQESRHENPVHSTAGGLPTVPNNVPSVSPHPEADPTQLDQTRDSDAMTSLTVALGIPLLDTNDGGSSVVVHDHVTFPPEEGGAMDWESSIVARPSSICSPPNSTGETSAVEVIVGSHPHVSPTMTNSATSDLGTNAPHPSLSLIQESPIVMLAPVACSPNKSSPMDVDPFTQGEGAIGCAVVLSPSVSSLHEMIDVGPEKVHNYQSGGESQVQQCDAKVSPMTTTSALEEGEIAETKLHTTASVLEEGEETARNMKTPPLFFPSRDTPDPSDMNVDHAEVIHASALTEVKDPTVADPQIVIDHGNMVPETSRFGVVDQLLLGGNPPGAIVNDAMLDKHPVDIHNANPMHAASGEIAIVQSNEIDGEGLKNRKRSQSPTCEGEDAIIRQRISGPPYPISPSASGTIVQYSTTDQATSGSSSDVVVDKNKANSGDESSSSVALRPLPAVGLVSGTTITTDHTSRMSLYPDNAGQTFNLPLSVDVGPNEILSNELNVPTLRGATSSIPPVGNGVGSAFSEEEMSVIAIHRGSRSWSTVPIEFNISEFHYALMVKWNNRNNSMDDMTESLCVSLACYSCADLQAILGRASKRPSVEELTAGGRCSWPRNGRLSMEVKYEEGRQRFPLSPPFAVTPDNLVDMFPFLEVGKNTVLLEQRPDMSDYIFVLHRHNPTRLQLQEVSARRKKNQDWKEWVLKISQPFKVQRRPWEPLDE